MFFFFLRVLRTILILCRTNDVLEQFEHTNRQTQKEENSLKHNPPKEVRLRLHSMKAKRKFISKDLNFYVFKTRILITLF